MERDEEAAIERSLDRYLDLYGNELRNATAEKIKLQEVTGSIVNTLLTLKRYSDFFPTGMFRPVLRVVLFYNAIEKFYGTIKERRSIKDAIKKQNFSKLMLETYDGLSERYDTIDARFQHLPNIETNREELEELEGLVGNEQTNESSRKLKLTLDELTSTYSLTLHTIDNYRRIIAEAWQIMYPKKDFPRDVSGLYNGAKSVSSS